MLVEGLILLILPKISSVAVLIILSHDISGQKKYLDNLTLYVISFYVYKIIWIFIKYGKETLKP